MNLISAEDIQKLAQLANISIDQNETVQLRDQLEAIIGFFEVLTTIDTKDIEPTSQVTGLTNVTREDKIVDYGVDHVALMKNVPDSKDGYIKVKRVLGA